MIEEIENADTEEVAYILEAALRRYAELYPDWEMNVVSIEKTESRNEQLNRMISFLEGLKHDESW